jgi:hypothetical protein
MQSSQKKTQSHTFHKRFDMIVLAISETRRSAIESTNFNKDELHADTKY